MTFKELLELENQLAELSLEVKRIIDTNNTTTVREAAETLGLPAEVGEKLYNGAAYNCSVETIAHFMQLYGYKLRIQIDK